MIAVEVFKNNRKTFYGNEMFSEVRRSFGSRGTPKPKDLFHEWVMKAQLILEGKPFSFKKHEYLELPYSDPHPFQVEMKAAQMGLTCKAGLRSIHGAITGKYPRGILYLFPSKSDVTDFSKARIAPLIEDNPESIGKWVVETDTSNLKQIGTAFLYLRGMRARVGLKSIPVDFIVFDELDEAPQIAVDMAMERMAHSEVREVLKLSNPTLPDFGIDKAFQETDQRYWLLKCPSCSHYTCLEDTFPACLVELSGGKVIRACEKCKTELDPAIGEWVAKRDSVKENWQRTPMYGSSQSSSRELVIKLVL